MTLAESHRLEQALKARGREYDHETWLTAHVFGIVRHYQADHDLDRLIAELDNLAHPYEYGMNHALLPSWRPFETVS